VATRVADGLLALGVGPAALRGIAQLTARLGAAFVLDPAG
jgi:hypothetical protein